MSTFYHPPDEVSELVIDFETVDRLISDIRSTFTPRPLTDSQIDLIGLLLRNPNGLCISEIATILNISTSAVVQIICSFNNLGFIERIHSEDDKRKVIARISKSGFEYFNANKAPFTRIYCEGLFGKLSDSEFKELRNLLKRLTY